MADDVLVQMIWNKWPEQPTTPVTVISEEMDYTVQNIVSVARMEDELIVSRATVEWTAGSAIVTSATFSKVPMGTLTVIADEWREEVGA